MKRARTLVISGLVIAALAATALAQVLTRDGRTRRASEIYELVIPPGIYTAIAIMAEPSERSSRLFIIETETTEFPIYIRPGETTIVPFEGGWTVRGEVVITPESDAELFSAWGITTAGPKRFDVRIRSLAERTRTRERLRR